MATKSAAPCHHAPEVGCDHCDPTGKPRSVFGDADGDFDAHDAQEIEAEVLAARYDDDPNPYEGTYGDDVGFCCDDC